MTTNTTKKAAGAINTNGPSTSTTLPEFGMGLIKGQALNDIRAQMGDHRSRIVNSIYDSPAFNALPLSKVVADPSNHSISHVSALSKPDKEAFTALASQFAPTGHTLHYVDRSGTYQAMRWGHIRDLATLDDARKFLVQIGGRHA